MTIFNSRTSTYRLYGSCNQKSKMLNTSLHQIYQICTSKRQIKNRKCWTSHYIKYIKTSNTKTSCMDLAIKNKFVSYAYALFFFYSILNERLERRFGPSITRHWVTPSPKTTETTTTTAATTTPGSDFVLSFFFQSSHILPHKKNWHKITRAKT